MQVEIVTLFGAMIEQAAGHSILSRAQNSGHLSLRCVDPRDFTTDKHRTADDTPFGGGAGMLMKADPLVQAIESVVLEESGGDTPPVIYLGPDGEPFTQKIAEELAASPHLVLVCGHYEGIDERVREGWITRTVSLGDYILTGGELAALVLLDATVRLLPGVLGNEHSAQEESFDDGLLEYPHYTRPAVFRDRSVPEVLLSGHHGNIKNWRRTQSLVRTRTRRLDLWERFLPLSKADQKLLDAYDKEQASLLPDTAVALQSSGDEPMS
jgi:tRNA (guanine37-N1)-methyltransferase